MVNAPLGLSGVTVRRMSKWTDAQNDFVNAFIVNDLTATLPWNDRRRSSGRVLQMAVCLARVFLDVFGDNAAGEFSPSRTHAKFMVGQVPGV